MHELGLLDGPLLSNSKVFSQHNLNAFMALGRPAWREARKTLQNLLAPSGRVYTDKTIFNQVLLPMNLCQMHIPAEIGDYTDLYIKYFS
jgi:fumarylacetoacetase